MPNGASTNILAGQGMRGTAAGGRCGGGAPHTGGSARPFGARAQGVVPPLGNKLYAFAAIDPFKKDAVPRIGTTHSSLNSRGALEKALACYGTDIAILNDNGSENMGKAEPFLAERGIAQYWTHPYSPKEKPHIERFIETFQRECLDYHYEPMNAAELQELADNWLEKYHFYRPHESLGGLTPAEFSATLGIAIPHTGRVL